MPSRARIKAQSNNRLLPRKHGPQIVRDFFELVRKSEFTVQEIAEMAGIDKTNLLCWGRTKSPMLFTFEAAVNTLGYKLVLQPIDNHT